MKKTCFLRYFIIGVLLAVFAVSAFELWHIFSDYAQADSFYESLDIYHPNLPSGDAADGVNQSIVDLKKKYPDTVGWLTVSGTGIDYPFVQAEDNDKYLRHDMDMNYLVSGTVFMDYRNAADFTDDVTVIYGHRMNNNTMFGDIKQFRDDEYFENHPDGYIFLSNHTYRMEIVSLLLVKSTNSEVYRFGTLSESDKQAFIKYITENALQSRKSTLSVQDRFVVLSTCAHDFDNARMVLVARLQSSATEMSLTDSSEASEQPQE